MQIDTFARRAHARARMARYLGLPAALLVLALAGCGGNGSDTPPGPGPGPGPTPVENEQDSGLEGPKSLGGRIEVNGASVVDSDINDPNYTDYRSNTEVTQAQTLMSPVTLVGSVNLLGKGDAQGRNFAKGDVYDWFRVPLAAGQVVELLVGESEKVGNDADLCILNPSTKELGCSESVTAHECVRASADGDYYVVVAEVGSSSTYNLQISAPGQGSTCENVTVPITAMVPGQLLAKPADTARLASKGSGMSSLEVTKRAMVNAGVERRSGIPALGIEKIQLPLQPDGGARALRALGAKAPAAGDGEAFEALNLMLYGKSLVASGAYAWAHPNWKFEALGQPVGALPAPDEGYALQRWHYDLIKLPGAMQVLSAMSPRPSQRPLVAVIDSGLMLEHPDIAPQLISRGRSFVTGISGNSGDGDRADGDTTARDAEDNNYHGTHVAGTIGAATFDTGRDSYGAGVAPMAQLLPINVAGVDDRFATVDVAEGILYAAGLKNRSGQLPPRRADVISMSLGGRFPLPCPEAYKAVIQAARSAGALIVVATGNAARNDQGQAVSVSSPGNCPGVFAVSAVDAQSKLSYYAQTGPEVAFTAPGGDVRQHTNSSGKPDGVYSAWGGLQGNKRVPSFLGIQGTSMATPHVSGVMALMRYVKPDITEAQIRAGMEAGKLSDDLGTPGKDNSYGWGLINARKAVEYALSLQTAGPPTPANSPIVALPQSMDFGDKTTQLSLTLQASGQQTNEKVVSITPSSPAVQVSPATDVAGLGGYTVTVDRAKLAEGSHFPTLSIQLQPARTLKVQLSVMKLAAASASARGSVGPVYVLLYDPDKNELVGEATARQQSPGIYEWSYPGYLPPKVLILAGTDLDNDSFICQSGEVCGGYPMLADINRMSVPLQGNRQDLDFTISAASGLSTASVHDKEAAWTQARRR